MQWTARFDEPIRLGTGKALRTLRDAADHITTLPRQLAELEHWQDAIACLIAAAEGKGPIDHNGQDWCVASALRRAGAA